MIGSILFWLTGLAYLIGLSWLTGVVYDYCASSAARGTPLSPLKASWRTYRSLARRKPALATANFIAVTLSLPCALAASAAAVSVMATGSISAVARSFGIAETPDAINLAELGPKLGEEARRAVLEMATVAAPPDPSQMATPLDTSSPLSTWVISAPNTPPTAMWAIGSILAMWCCFGTWHALDVSQRPTPRSLLNRLLRRSPDEQDIDYSALTDVLGRRHALKLQMRVALVRVFCIGLIGGPALGALALMLLGLGPALGLPYNASATNIAVTGLAPLCVGLATGVALTLGALLLMTRVAPRTYALYRIVRTGLTSQVKHRRGWTNGMKRAEVSDQALSKLEPALLYVARRRETRSRNDSNATILLHAIARVREWRSTIFAPFLTMQEPLRNQLLAVAGLIYGLRDAGAMRRVANMLEALDQDPLNGFEVSRTKIPDSLIEAVSKRTTISDVASILSAIWLVIGAAIVTYAVITGKKPVTDITP